MYAWMYNVHIYANCGTRASYSEGGGGRNTHSVFLAVKHYYMRLAGGDR